MRARLSAAFPALALLCACSGTTTAPVSNRGGGSAAPSTATPVPGGITGPDITPAYEHWDMSKPFHILVDCAPMSNPPSLREMLLHTGLTSADPEQSARAAAIVRVAGAGAPRWNTPDGSPPSQAFIDALHHPTRAPDGSWPVQPNIVTGYRLDVLRVVRGAAPSSGFAGYLNGGTVGQHVIQWGCLTTAEHVEKAPPAAGHTYLVLFGPELGTQRMGAQPLAQPMMSDMLPYDPATDTVVDAAGRIRLADALRGLPPG
ncbi:MAG TPA: hypothetical protein VN193_06910 [Candidatus Angelobacter sp.]|jgi:hypothetical protein|nr:hypothetical protein [Candidatus Angelobacter sp.]